MAARRRTRSTTRAGALALPRRDGGAVRALPSRTSVLIGLAVFACAAGAFAVARQTSLFAVAVVQVRGGTPAVQHEVAKALEGEVGVSLLRIDGGTIERRLAGVSSVASATFDRAFPYTLTVTIRPERPVAVLRRGAASWLVSARGRLISELHRGAYPGLPRIWVGAKTAPPSLGAVLADTGGGSAARALAPLPSVHFPAHVASVATGAAQLTLVLRSGLELRLGDSGDLRLKLAVARRVLAQLGPVAGGYVDVSVPERPVASTNPQVGG